MYFPYAQLPLRFTNLVVRTHGEPTAVAGLVRTAVAEIDPTLALAGTATMREVLSDTVAAPRVIAILLGISSPFLRWARGSTTGPATRRFYLLAR